MAADILEEFKIAQLLMFASKPVIGISGGIGSGKSFVAKLFEELGCVAINSDNQISEAYRRVDVKEALRRWWGDDVFQADGEIRRGAIAARIFSDVAEKKRLEGLLHPLVMQMRDAEMTKEADNPKVLAYVWDTPLLFETGLDRDCDALVFVDTPREIRLDRLRRQRRWEDAELTRRENLQMPLDKKREMSEYNIRNTAGADKVRIQVREVLSRILADVKRISSPEGPSASH